MRINKALACLTLIAACATAAAAAAAAGGPASMLYDKDHPHGFDPSIYPARAAWERRAEFLRTQALVSQGLWPMPVKTPLAPVVHGRIDRGDYTIEKVFFASLP